MEQLGDRGHGVDVLFQLVDFGISSAGQQLHHKATGAEDGQVFVHQHAQRHHGRHLFAVGVVTGQILGNFTGYQRHLPDCGLLLQAVVPDDGQHAVLAHGSAHVQVAVGFGGQLHQRVINAALHVAGAIGAGNEHARRAAARHTQGDAVAVVLEHGAHQGCTGKQTPKCCAASSACGVKLFCFTDDLGGIHTAEHDSAVLGQAADQVCHRLSLQLCILFCCAEEIALAFFGQRTKGFTIADCF